jgi:ElaB/YqjD/DUF883 family membrane-anchored ribosome-binding protein
VLVSGDPIGAELRCRAGVQNQRNKERHKMADTDDLAPARNGNGQTESKAAAPARAPRKTAAARRSTSTRARAARTEEDLEDQLDRLQDDVKAIMKSLGRMGNEKVNEAQGRAKSEYKNLVHAGEGMLENVQDEFSQVEKQIKDTIRQKPLTAVLSAVGVGFLIAVLTR